MPKSVRALVLLCESRPRGTRYLDSGHVNRGAESELSRRVHAERWRRRAGIVSSMDGGQSRWSLQGRLFPYADWHAWRVCGSMAIFLVADVCGLPNFWLFAISSAVQSLDRMYSTSHAACWAKATSLAVPGNRLRLTGWPPPECMIPPSSQPSPVDGAVRNGPWARCNQRKRAESDVKRKRSHRDSLCSFLWFAFPTGRLVVSWRELLSSPIATTSSQRQAHGGNPRELQLQEAEAHSIHVRTHDTLAAACLPTVRACTAHPCSEPRTHPSPPKPAVSTLELARAAVCRISYSMVTTATAVVQSSYRAAGQEVTSQPPASGHAALPALFCPLFCRCCAPAIAISHSFTAVSETLVRARGFLWRQ